MEEDQNPSLQTISVTPALGQNASPPAAAIGRHAAAPVPPPGTLLANGPKPRLCTLQKSRFSEDTKLFKIEPNFQPESGVWLQFARGTRQRPFHWCRRCGWHCRTCRTGWALFKLEFHQFCFTGNRSTHCGREWTPYFPEHAS